MKIGYRRVSGKLPLTPDENGARGTWLEKRLGLIQALQNRGHSFDWLSEPTANSAAAGFQKVPKGNLDVLMLEFGGTNLMFNKKAWEETFALIKAHTGKIIFLCDDPDLSFLWNELPDEDWSRWTIAANAIMLATTKVKLHVPLKANLVDAPFHALLTQREFSPGTKPTAIYYGRPNGRLKLLDPFIQTGALAIAGKESEWNDPAIRLLTPPEQKERSDWYRQFRACFAVNDSKHTITGWRTGRAYHALLAGIPVAVPANNNPALDWAWQCGSPADLIHFLHFNQDARKEIFEKQVVAAKREFPFEALGL